jgi:protein CpxP
MKTMNHPAGTMRLAVSSLAMTMVAACLFINPVHAEEADGARGHGRGGHGMRMDGDMNPARADKMIARRISRIPDVTPDQKTRLTAIAKTSMTEMRPLQKQSHANRVEIAKLLAAPTIDRAAIERLRANQVALQQQISAGRTKAMMDAADVLTPAQRAKIAERMAKRSQRHQHKRPA